MTVAGEAVRLLGGFGRRYAVTVRLATLPPIAVIGLLRATPDAFAGTALAVAVAVVWTCGYGWWLRSGAGRGGVAVDAAVLLGVCSCVFWTDVIAAGNTGWLRLLVTFACVTWQWHTPPLTGALAALATGGGMIVLVAVAGRPDVWQAWLLVMAAISRAAWVLVTKAAERADRMTAAAQRARRAAAVAAAERAQERELANSLHDTAATTLLMVGVGQVPPGAAWLAPQARRDLARLRTAGERFPDRADLVEALRADLEAGHLTTELDAPEHLSLPFDVTTAITGAVQEALNNVRRHAGTDRATVRVHGDATALRVEVADEGRGFATTDEPGPTRRGLRESVYGRLRRIGGTATVTSTEGTGTVVRLEWRADE